MRALKIGGIVLLFLVVVLCLLAWFGGRALKQDQPQMFAEPIYDTEILNLPGEFIAQSKQPAILVFSKTNGFRHRDGIAGAKAFFESLALEQDWLVYYSENASVFSEENLKHFSVVIGSNATGPLFTPDQQTAFQAYLEGGGGYVALHSSGDSSHADWGWYEKQVVRAAFTGHGLFPQVQMATVSTESSAHPAMQHLPANWTHEEEWYCFESSPRASVNVLASIDESDVNFWSIDHRDGVKLRDLAMGADHPVIWSHDVGNGRVFYSALGHYAVTYTLPDIQTMLKNAVIWAGRLDG